MRPVNKSKMMVRKWLPTVIAVAVILLAAFGLLRLLLRAGARSETPAEPTSAPEIAATPTPAPTPEPVAKSLKDYARAHNLQLSVWPQELQELFEKNPDARRFVQEYPEKKDLDPVIDLTAEAKQGEIPALYQWDDRWGYRRYIGNFLGLSGCAPTSMSMAIIGLTGNADADPWTLAQYAEENGHYEPGNGTSWSFITSVGPLYGVEVREIGLDQNLLDSELRAGHVVCCCVGPGDFTEYGHYFLIVGVEDGLYRIHDPNSVTNTNKLWEYDRLAKQTLCLWSLQAAN